jgi:hypothetical protein
MSRLSKTNASFWKHVMSLRSRREHKAQGEAKRTLGMRVSDWPARGVGGRVLWKTAVCRPFPGL